MLHVALAVTNTRMCAVCDAKVNGSRRKFLACCGPFEENLRVCLSMCTGAESVKVQGRILYSGKWQASCTLLANK